MIKGEIYYQDLYDVPIEEDPASIFLSLELCLWHNHDGPEQRGYRFKLWCRTNPGEVLFQEILFPGDYLPFTNQNILQVMP